jgi:hypothetical protein
MQSINKKLHVQLTTKLPVNYLQLHVEQICLTFKLRGCALLRSPSRMQG